MRYFILIISFLLVGSLFSQQKKVYTTQRITQAPKIDGLLDDEAWSKGNWEGNFVQREPKENSEPTEPTEFKVFYDDNYIYVAIKSFEKDVSKIDNRLTRRDQFDGDMVGVHFDSYFDKRTSFSFFVNAAGVKSDAIYSNGGSKEDKNWNPIWWVKTGKDSLGWTAEMKIPLSQLRFSKKDNKVWGFEVSRYIFRLQELSLWAPVPMTSSGWPYYFGELHGISNLKPKRIVEVAPYFVGGIETYEKEEANPFAQGRDFLYGVGVDGKVGITNDFILDFTINPDFGQVEADPSEVNLTAFETFFREQRPFFIEGSNIFDFKIQPGEHESARDNLFYSRRIGRMPQYYPQLSDSEYIDFPRETRILGAMKVSGKTKDGFSLGIMESVTAETMAEIDTKGQRKEEVVEPMTNYFISRIQKDFDHGNNIIGGEITSTNRSINSHSLYFLPKNALTGGLDYTHYWKNQEYFFTANSAFSNINGDSAAIAYRQTASQRYYQRPDAYHLNLDSSRTSLSGYGGNIGAGKNGEKGLTYSINLNWRSPGFSLNDVGYLRNTDKITEAASMSYYFIEPKYFYRKIGIGFIQWNGFDFGGKPIFNGGMTWLNAQLKNYYNIYINLDGEFRIHDNYKLRGGPAFSQPGNLNLRISTNTNETKKFHMDFGTRQGWGQFGSFRQNSWDAGFIYRPFDALSMEFHPNFYSIRDDLQYVNTSDYQGDNRYILARLNQKTMVFRFRVNFNITPDLTIQYYGSPFISTGIYDNFKRVTQANAKEFSNRIHEFTPDEISYNETDEVYWIDENRDGNDDYYIDNPDFHFKQFQSNFVVRWEFTPGSIIYLVWSQNRTNYDGYGLFNYFDDMNVLFNTFPDNVFLLKFSYRFIR